MQHFLSTVLGFILFLLFCLAMFKLVYNINDARKRQQRIFKNTACILWLIAILAIYVFTYLFFSPLGKEGLILIGAATLLITPGAIVVGRDAFLVNNGKTLAPLT